MDFGLAKLVWEEKPKKSWAYQRFQRQESRMLI